MARQIGTLRTLKTVKALKGESLKIDLGKAFTGTLTSWMKKDTLEDEYIEFDIVDSRYLFLTKAKTADLFDTKNKVAGKWYFDVRHLAVGGTADDEKTIFVGTILFHNNVTS